MEQNLFQKHFTMSAPDQNIQNVHRGHIAKAYENERQRILKIEKERRDTLAQYQVAMIEMLKKQGGLKNIPSKNHESASAEFKRSKEQAKSQMMLHPRMASATPFVGWVGLSPTTSSPSNSAWGEFNGDSVYLQVGAGMEEQEGGSATAWGYVGQYFATNSPANQVAVLVKANASTLVGFSPQWTTTNIWPFTSDTATLNLWVNLICMVYDTNWNFLNTISSPPASIYSTNSDAGSFGWVLPQPSSQSFQLSLESIVAANNNLGVFVQFFATASADGASTGALDPGSSAFAWLRGMVQSFQVQAPGH